MSQIIMLFLFPIGLYFYIFVEKKGKVKYQKVFDDFEAKITSSSELDPIKKKKLYIQMLEHNGYNITKTTDAQVEGEKKILSMSLLAMSAGVFYVGVLFYLGYYYWVQKPHVVVYKI